jgi:hypothetical protein
MYRIIDREDALKTMQITKQVFVIMPFQKTPSRDENELTEFYNTNLKECIENEDTFIFKYVVRRSDDTFNITKRIIHELFNADIVLCDLSGFSANQNVMYELGIRLSISNKPVILFRESSLDNIQIFDISWFHIFEYSVKKYRELEEYIINKIKKFEKNEETFESPILLELKTNPIVIQ